MPMRTSFQIALATLWLACMPAEAHSIDIGWIRLTSRVQLDAPRRLSVPAQAAYYLRERKTPNPGLIRHC